MSEAIGTLGTTLSRGAQHIAQAQDVSGPDLTTVPPYSIGDGGRR